MVWVPVALSHIHSSSAGENISGIYHYVPNSLMCHTKISLVLAPRAPFAWVVVDQTCQTKNTGPEVVLLIKDSYLTSHCHDNSCPRMLGDTPLPLESWSLWQCHVSSRFYIKPSRLVVGHFPSVLLITTSESHAVLFDPPVVVTHMWLQAASF